MTGWVLSACVAAATAGCVAAPVQTSPEPTAAPAEARRCEPGKLTCRHMRDCDEALYYLRECGVSKLDKDKDGVPCESLCLR
ncbi:MAG: excalibur calcium-binding domain-containing protein [Hydrogenophilales bacterium]|nr:excalibur calcium-binding domain-containing protein [Hydrogenophilales bacterium]